ncbi:MAG: lipid-A-disaccharide synthase [Magnetococcus sp. DMHC-6]
MRLMIVAGEASGDLLGGDLLAGLKEHFPQIQVCGVGGPRLAEQGLLGPFGINDLSVIGIVEVVHRLPRLRRVFRYLTHLLTAERPDLLITIDLPDFNFMLAKRAKALHIPVIHYVCPQVWAWRRGRVQRIASLVDHLLVLFPFEPIYFQPTGLPVTFVGHPLVEKTRSKLAKRLDFRKQLELSNQDKLVVLLPGSRSGELQRHLEVMVSTCHQLAQRLSKVQFILALAENLSLEEVENFPWPIRQGMTQELLAASDAALVASGTATLEAALLDAPMVVIYRVNFFTYEIGRRVIQVPFISLANLVVQRELVKERIQKMANPDLLADDLFTLLTDSEQIARIRSGYQEIRTLLSSQERGAVEIVSQFLQGTHNI